MATATLPVPEAAAADPLALAIFADNRPWAISAAALQSLLTAVRHPDFEAIAGRVGQRIEGGRGAQNHNGTALINIRGPLLRYPSIFTWLLGGTAIEDSFASLQAAMDDPTVRAIVLAINSPGGQVDGINAMANKIRAANSEKPVTAFVDLAASGGYWLAAAAGRIVLDETAQLGSIGVLATVTDSSAADQRSGVKRFDIVSSQSPLKRTDPATDEGRAQLQAMVDAMAQIFIDKVASFRGTTSAKVASDFGRGAMLSADAAIAAGMADSTGSLEGLLRGEGTSAPVRTVRDKPGLRVAAAAPFDEQELEEGTEDAQLNKDANCTCPPGTETCHCRDQGADPDNDNDAEGDNDNDEDGDQGEGTEQEPDESSVPRGEALMTPTEERQRIAAILTCEEARGREELARALALETDTTLEAAKKLLAIAPAARANPLEVRMGQIQNPTVLPGTDGQPDSTAVEVQRILAFVPKERLKLHARQGVAQ